MRAATQHNNDDSTDQLVATATHLKDDVRELSGAIRNASVGYYKAGVDKAVQLKKASRKTISDNPFQSVLIAAGVGLVVGYLIRRR